MDEHVAHHALLDHVTLIQHRHAVADRLDDLHFVGDDYDGHAQLLVDLLEQIQNMAGGVGIQRGGGLVAEQHLRIHRQRAGDGHALLLTAGELAGIGLHAVAQAHQVKQLLRALLCVAPGHMGDLHRIANVADGVALGHQVEVLKDHADGLAR